MKFENLESAANYWKQIWKINEQILRVDEALAGVDEIDFKIHPDNGDDEWIGLDDPGLGDACAKAIKKVLVNRRNVIKSSVAKL